jgi:hypothetical protein
MYTTFPIYNLGNTLLKVSLFFNGKLNSNKLFLLNDFINLTLFGIKSSGLTIFCNLAICDSRNVFLYNNITYSCSLISNYNIKLLPIHKNLGRISHAEIIPMYNLINNSASNNRFNYLLGIDSNNLSKSILINSFSIYQGCYILSNEYKFLNILLPTMTHIETNNSYINIHGQLKYLSRVVIPTKGLRTDRNIIRAISIAYGAYTNYILF